MVKLQLPKLAMRVRFPLLAPKIDKSRQKLVDFTFSLFTLEARYLTVYGAHFRRRPVNCRKFQKINKYPIDFPARCQYTEKEHIGIRRIVQARFGSAVYYAGADSAYY